jgi:hypothetical protein
VPTILFQLLREVHDQQAMGNPNSRPGTRRAKPALSRRRIMAKLRRVHRHANAWLRKHYQTFGRKYHSR